MARKVSGAAKPGTTRTRKVSKGPNKGDTVTFKANTASAQEPGKLKPRTLVKDIGRKNRTTSLKRKNR